MRPIFPETCLNYYFSYSLIQPVRLWYYPIQIAVARVRVGGENCMKQGPDDRHAVA